MRRISTKCSEQQKDGLPVTYLAVWASTVLRVLAAEVLALPPLVLRLLSAVASSHDWPLRKSDLVMYVPPSNPMYGQQGKVTRVKLSHNTATASRLTSTPPSAGYASGCLQRNQHYINQCTFSCILAGRLRARRYRRKQSSLAEPFRILLLEAFKINPVTLQARLDLHRQHDLSNGLAFLYSTDH